MNLKHDMIEKSSMCLIQCGIKSLPVQLGKICRIFQTKIIKLSDISDSIDELDTHGALIRLDGKLCIVVNDSEPMQDQRIMIASEIGRVFTGESLSDIEAHQFAVNLLAPIPVLYAMHVRSYAQIRKICDIPVFAARYQFEIIQNLKNDYDVLDNVDLYSQFHDFIFGKNDS